MVALSHIKATLMIDISLHKEANRFYEIEPQAVEQNLMCVCVCTLTLSLILLYFLLLARLPWKGIYKTPHLYVYMCM